MESQERVTLGIFDKKILEMEEKGILFIDDPFVADSTALISRMLIYVAMREQRKVAGEPHNPIWIYLNSPGGLVHCGFAIHDIIKGITATGTKVNIVGLGAVASLSVAIMQAASRRYALPNTQFMVHQVNINPGGAEINKMEEVVAESAKINRLVMNLISERAGIDLGELMDVSRKKDCWFSAIEAKDFGKYGLIDEILIELPGIVPVKQPFLDPR